MTAPVEVKAKSATLGIGRREVDVVQVEANGMPWWVKAIVQIGIWPSIVIGLIWFVTMIIGTRIESAAAGVEKANNLLQIHIETMNRTEVQRQIHEQRVLRVLIQQCINSGASSQARAGCVQ